MAVTPTQLREVARKARIDESEDAELENAAAGYTE